MSEEKIFNDSIYFNCPFCGKEHIMSLKHARYYFRSGDRFQCESCKLKIKLRSLDVFQELKEKIEEWETETSLEREIEEMKGMKEIEFQILQIIRDNQGNDQTIGISEYELKKLANNVGLCGDCVLRALRELLNKGMVHSPSLDSYRTTELPKP
jgi:predicted RNA-binding Zn-ribbon protein involved in translation (DUF1610 family)